MKIVCGPKGHAFPAGEDELDVLLYSQFSESHQGTIGAAVTDTIIRQQLKPSQRAWDFLSLALSVIASDLAGFRNLSPDGWTRQFDLEVAVAEPDFWTTQKTEVQRLLGFLTTDLWEVTFVSGGYVHKPPTLTFPAKEKGVALLSGGLDSFIGVADLIGEDREPILISQTVRGDAENQRAFAQLLAPDVRHLQLNHNARLPNPEDPPSQRGRSLLFIAYGLLAATTTSTFFAGEIVKLFVCENGFISINPPLTGSRLGSLSTRTTHPVFFNGLNRIFAAAGLGVEVTNPYQLKTKGEMMFDCVKPDLLLSHAHATTSCGRFKQFGYKHCGRCVPCLVRRSAFLASGIEDRTIYVHTDLGQDDERHAGFDDVRSAAMAVAEAKMIGLESWIGVALSTALVDNVDALQQTIGRGLKELEGLLESHGVK